MRHHMLAGFPPSVSPSSHAVEADGFVFLTGQFPRDLDDPEAPLPEGIAAQTEQVFDNLDAVLAEAGAGFADVAKATVFVTDLGDFARLNAVYETRFGGHKPARSTVQVAALPRGASVEIELVARIPA